MQNEAEAQLKKETLSMDFLQEQFRLPESDWDERFRELIRTLAEENQQAILETHEILEKGVKPFSTKYKYYDEVYRSYQETENIINHHSEENQTILADYFSDIILKEKSDITIEKFKEFNKPFEFYYKKI